MICDFAVRRTENSEQHAQAVRKEDSQSVEGLWPDFSSLSYPKQKQKEAASKGKHPKPDREAEESSHCEP